MNDTPQNDPGIEQKPAPENGYDYQQYLGPENGPPKDRRKLIIIGIIALFVILIAVLLIVLLTGGNKPGQSDQNQTASNVSETCSDDNCFENNFTQCTPAEYTYNDPKGTVKYTITGIGGLGCPTRIEYVSGIYLQDGAGKTMTCDLDNGVDFKTATYNAFKYPDDFECQGTLADEFRSLNSVIN